MSVNSKQAAAVGMTAAIALTAFLLLLLFSTSIPVASASEEEFRWDIVTVTFPGDVPTVSAGGSALATANSPQGSIVLTGSGTFELDGGDVTGGGAWTTFSGPGGTGALVASGTYVVTGLVSFELAPGALPGFIGDTIGANADARAGTAVLTVEYSDGSTGTLVVVCDLTHIGGAFTTGFEGVTPTKGIVNFWLPNDPTDIIFAPEPASNTLFHVLED